jgi:DNA-binding beta-propeller fold protein YncE
MEFKIVLLVLPLIVCSAARADILVSGNEGKFDLSSGVGRPVDNPTPDTLSVLDFAVFPPRVRHVQGVPNSVLGPPSNIAITPDEKFALVANSVRRYTRDLMHPEPDSIVQVVDLSLDPPAIIQRVRVGKQPSGLSIDRGGRLAIVANRGDGTVSVLSIAGRKVRVEQTLVVSAADGEPSDVAISPDGTQALVTIRNGSAVRALSIEGSKVTLMPRKLPVYGQPYHVQITPDGALGLVAGSGGMEGPDIDAISVIDLRADPIRTIDYVAVGSGPESFDISPDGKLVAAVLMNGSSLPSDNPQRTEAGQLVLLARTGNKFAKVQELPIGRIPEGVTFSPDGKYLVVQHHPARELAIFEVAGQRLQDTGQRIKVPGMPSSLRRADHAR